jgi:hypothetical protein
MKFDVRPGLLACVLGSACALQSAAAAPFSDDKFEEMPWEEVAQSLPAQPKDDALIEVDPSLPMPFRYGLDPASVSVGADGVIRYTVVAISSSGARNIAYEGMRCDSRERRIYALSNGSGWHKARNAAWQPVKVDRNTAVQAELYMSAFCDGKTVWGDVPVLLQRVRTIKQRGGHTQILNR